MVECRCGATADLYVCMVIGRSLRDGSETDYVDGYVCDSHEVSEPARWLLSYPTWDEVARETMPL